MLSNGKHYFPFYSTRFTNCAANSTLGKIESSCAAGSRKPSAPSFINTGRIRAAGDDSLQGRVRALSAIRREQGYMAECAARNDGSFLLRENHCPICAAAKFCQGLCREELELFRAVLGPQVKVERTDHILAGASRCAYVITPRRGARERGPEPKSR